MGRFQTHHYSYHDIFPIDPVHGPPPAERLSALAAHGDLTVPSPCDDFVVLSSADFAVHPHSLQNLQAGDVVVEAALSLDLKTTLSDEITVACINGLGASDEEGPEKELVDTRRNRQCSNVIQHKVDRGLEFRR